MPRAFYDDWVAVALEETTHFGFLSNRLEALGSFYGILTTQGHMFTLHLLGESTLSGQRVLQPDERRSPVAPYILADKF